MTRKALAIFALVLAGCTVSVVPTPGATGSPVPGSSQRPSTAPSSTPAPSASTFTLDDLSGSWTFGSTAEPAAGPVTVRCIGYAATTLDLRQTGTAVTGTEAVCMGPCRLTERLTGMRGPSHLDLTGTAPEGNVTYSLDLVASTGHLVGTRNGQPYWAARAVSPPGQENCPR
jgi:hypothetical protein